MRYVLKLLSDIETKSQYSLGGKELTFNVLVRSLETGEIVERKARELIHSDALGVGIHADGLTCAVVALTRKQALLHRYVKSVSWERGMPRLGICDISEDTLTLSSSGNFRWTGRDNYIIAINTSGEMIQAFGNLGSVIVRYRTMRSSAEVCTLYDLLCDLCVESSCNIMRYSRIRLYSELRTYTLVLELANSNEAVRFYNKMYLDAMQGGVK